MDDIQLIIYIALIAFGLISRLLKSKKNAPPKRQKAKAPEPKAEQPPGQTFSFEELLKEFTETKEPKPAPPPVTPVTTLPDSREHPLRNDDEVLQTYEKAVRKSPHYEKEPLNASYRKVVDPSKSEDYPDNKKEAEEDRWATWLRNPDSARKAIILSEIINRKYT